MRVKTPWLLSPRPWSKVTATWTKKDSECMESVCRGDRDRTQKHRPSSRQHVVLTSRAPRGVTGGRPEGTEPRCRLSKLWMVPSEESQTITKLQFPEGSVEDSAVP